MFFFFQAIIISVFNQPTFLSQKSTSLRVQSRVTSGCNCMPGTVQIHYEIEGVLLNNKDYVSGKEPLVRGGERVSFKRSKKKAWLFRIVGKMGVTWEPPLRSYLGFVFLVMFDGFLPCDLTHFAPPFGRICFGTFSI